MDGAARCLPEKARAILQIVKRVTIQRGLFSSAEHTLNEILLLVLGAIK